MKPAQEQIQEMEVAWDRDIAEATSILRKLGHADLERLRALGDYIFHPAFRKSDEWQAAGRDLHESGEEFRNVRNILSEQFSEAVCSITPERLDLLKSAGIPDKVINSLICGIAPIETHGRGLYEPRDDGPLAVLVPCGFHDGLNWQLDDVVAFFLDRPDRWWCRRGDAVLLGDLQHFAIEPRRLHARPIDWLRDGGTGLCLLDWQVDPIDLLAGAGELVADRPLLTRLRKSTVQAASARLDRIVSYG